MSAMLFPEAFALDAVLWVAAMFLFLLAVRSMLRSRLT